jgi:hypothetical protein
MDVEKLLRWAYQEELAKKRTSSAEGIWDRLHEVAERGGIDIGHGAAQRYPHFGLPDPDAERIEVAVGALPDQVIDWDRDAEAVMGGLLGLADPRSKKGLPRNRPSTASWPSRTRKQHETASVEPPRDVLMVRSYRTATLITMHAAMGTRPDWYPEPSRPLPVPASRGPGFAVVGECYGRDRYQLGAYCPLRWDPSPMEIADARAEYLAWHRGLLMLCERLELRGYIAARPGAPEMPWRAPQDSIRVVYEAPVRPQGRLPLHPARPLMAAPMARPKNSKVRVVDDAG